MKLFVVAIDFGTTFSGYAFSNFSNKDQIYTYNWTQGIGQSPKTPTSILFTPRKDFHSFGYDAEEEYARRSLLGQNKDWYFFKRFKMMLYKNTDVNEMTKIKDYTGKEMPAINVFSAGIRFLKEHIFCHFQEHIPMLLRDDDIHWVLTVPAIWNEAAKKFMRKAAEIAGILGDQLTLALEPEAAALFCQMKGSTLGLPPLDPEKKFLLLDCGGGTVDVTVHEVRYDKSLKEIQRASGGPWGGIKVDDEFENYLTEIFGVDTIIKVPKNEVIELEKSFEILKKRVGTNNNTYTIQIPLTLKQAAPYGTMVAGRLKLDSKTVKGFFKKPIKEICDHVRKVITSLRFQELKTIILVGGFSESQLLQEEIKRNFPFFTIVAPDDPGSAVVKGAVTFGHSPEKIRFRMSPHTYGISVAVPFRDGVHPISKLFTVDGEKYCRGIFHIHVRKNQEVETGTIISSENYSPLYPFQTTQTITVVVSDKTSPTFVDEADTTIIGRFEVQIPDVNSGLERVVNVNMIFSGTELKVEAKDKSSGRMYNSTFEFK